MKFSQFFDYHASGDEGHIDALRECIRLSDENLRRYPDRRELVKYVLIGSARLSDDLRQGGQLRVSRDVGQAAILPLSELTHPDRVKIWFAPIERAPLRSTAETSSKLRDWNLAI